MGEIGAGSAGHWRGTWKGTFPPLRLAFTDA